MDPLGRRGYRSLALTGGLSSGAVGLQTARTSVLGALVVRLQDVGTIVRSVLTILLDQRTKQHLQMAARETALRLNPSAIADRLSSLLPLLLEFECISTLG